MTLWRVENIRVGIDTRDEEVKPLLCRLFGIPASRMRRFALVKKAVDARHKKSIRFVYAAEMDIVGNLPFTLPPSLVVKPTQASLYRCPRARYLPKAPPVVVGAGPCGLLAGLLLAKAGLFPLIIERGKSVPERIKDVERFMGGGPLDLESNVQFGEGGSGTFSDGKLFTRVRDRRIRFLFETLIKAGAPSEIAYDAHPHIGTDRLRTVVPNLRRMICEAGGTVRFGSKLTDIEVQDRRIVAVWINGEERIATSHLILATGHSARDTITMLFEKGLQIVQKPFSIGVRIEHKRVWIDRLQYGSFAGHPNLPAARYQLAVHLKNNRGVYTFCMCPGGDVIAAASEPGHLVTNGMSAYAQDGENSNSAILVGIMPSDFGSDHPLAGVTFQCRWERLAFETGGGGYAAPIQRVEDFLQDQTTRSLGDVIPTYRPSVVFAPIRECLPEWVVQSLKEGLLRMDRRMKGFAHPDAVLTGIETRSSAPYRIARNAQMESNLHGLYPAGEGAGQAGGIVSAALDGMRAAEAIIRSCGG